MPFSHFKEITVPWALQDGKLEPVYWVEALEAVAEAAKGFAPSEMMAVSGKLVEAESLMALKDLMNKMGCENLRSEIGFGTMDADVRSNYIMVQLFISPLLTGVGFCSWRVRMSYS